MQRTALRAAVDSEGVSAHADTVQALTWRNSRWAGGARKNRLYDGEIVLDRGDYEAHFKTDHSHAWGDWNALPPDEAAMWGMTVIAVGPAR